MNKQFDIQEIIKGCKRFERQFQKALVDECSGLLYVISNRYLGNPLDAQDATQECLALIFKNIKSYDCNKGAFESWISTITIRHCLNRLSKKKTKVSHPLPIGNEHHVSDFENEMLSRLNKAQILKLVSELPDSYRIVFNMAAIDGYSHREIAKALNLTEINSRTLLNRARKILQTKIMTINKHESWVNTI